MYGEQKDRKRPDILEAKRERGRLKSVRANVQCVRDKQLMPNMLPDLLQMKRVTTVIQTAKEDAPMSQSLPGILSGLKRHHIIPDSILQTFWNTVSGRVEQSEEDRDLFEGMRNMAFRVHKSRYADGGRIIRDEINQMDAMKEYGQFYSIDDEKEKAARGDLSDQSIEEIDEKDLRSMFVWMPGNIVIGPLERQLEPGNTLDREAMLIAGKDSMKIQELYALMLKYIYRDAFAEYERLSELLTENMSSPYINVEVGKFVKKGIENVSDIEHLISKMFDIEKGCNGEEWLLEDALKSIGKMQKNVKDTRLDSLLVKKEQEFKERLREIREP